jgi:hypothetical protein
MRRRVKKLFFYFFVNYLRDTLEALQEKIACSFPVRYTDMPFCLFSAFNSYFILWIFSPHIRILIMRFFLTFPSGDNVVIEDSYIWDGVEIQNNSHISKSLVCDNVLVKQYVFMNFNVWPTSSKKDLLTTRTIQWNLGKSFAACWGIHEGLSMNAIYSSGASKPFWPLASTQGIL